MDDVQARYNRAFELLGTEFDALLIVPPFAERIVRGEACRDLDTLPEPSFEDYFAQPDNALPTRREDSEVWLPYESSRGCWWGARQHCTFCGLNDETMFFRGKSPERVIAGVAGNANQTGTPARFQYKFPMA